MIKVTVSYVDLNEELLDKIIKKNLSQDDIDFIKQFLTSDYHYYKKWTLCTTIALWSFLVSMICGFRINSMIYVKDTIFYMKKYYAEEYESFNLY